MYKYRLGRGWVFKYLYGGDGMPFPSSYPELTFARGEDLVADDRGCRIPMTAGTPTQSHK